MCNPVTNPVTSPFVTLPPTRPDPTRPITVLAQVCGLSVVKVNHHHQAVTREPSPQSDDELGSKGQTNNGGAA